MQSPFYQQNAVPPTEGGHINPTFTNSSFAYADNMSPQQQWVPQFQNGRVITTGTHDHLKPFNLIPNNNDDNDSFRCEAVKGILTTNKLNQAFFSKCNIKNLQNLVRYQVYKHTKNHYVIAPQSVTDLEVIMRSVYLQHGKNLDYDIPQQVSELNMWVVEITVPRIITEIEQYIGYRHDLEKLPTPISLPENLSSKGTKLLRSVTTTF